VSKSRIAADLQERRKVEFPFHYSTKGKYVQIVARIADAPGTLASVLTALGEKVDLVGTSSYSAEEGTAIFSGFGRVLSESDDADSIEKHAVKSRSLHGCKVWESREGLLVDSFHHGLQTTSGEAYLMIPTMALASTFETLVKTFGTGGETILYYQGKDYAKARWELYRKVLGPHPENRFTDLTAIFTALGWGISTVKFEGGRVSYVTKDCFECSVGTHNGRRCSFLRGMAVGTAEGIFGKEIICEETLCRLKGDDVCEFVLASKDDTPLVGS
jgi:predicted hydrocarbon binding protein